MALGVLDVFRDLIAEGAFAESRQPVAQFLDVAVLPHVLRPERTNITENMFINDC